ncbi:hypothetical protein Tco_0015128 [Tanacetum coccineum]
MVTAAVLGNNEVLVASSVEGLGVREMAVVGSGASGIGMTDDVMDDGDGVADGGWVRWIRWWGGDGGSAGRWTGGGSRDFRREGSGDGRGGWWRGVDDDVVVEMVVMLTAWSGSRGGGGCGGVRWRLRNSLLKNHDSGDIGGVDGDEMMKMDIKSIRIDEANGYKVVQAGTASGPNNSNITMKTITNGDGMGREDISRNNIPRIKFNKWEELARELM